MTNLLLPRLVSMPKHQELDSAILLLGVQASEKDQEWSHRALHYKVSTWNLV